MTPLHDVKAPQGGNQFQHRPIHRHTPAVKCTLDWSQTKNDEFCEPGRLNQILSIQVFTLNSFIPLGDSTQLFPEKTKFHAELEKTCSVVAHLSCFKGQNGH